MRIMKLEYNGKAVIELSPEEIISIKNVLYYYDDMRLVRDSNDIELYRLSQECSSVCQYGQTLSKRAIATADKLSNKVPNDN